MVVYVVLCLTVLASITVAQVEFRFEKSTGYNAGDSAKLIAKYIGGGTEQFVHWYYSERVSSDNIVDIQHSCQLFTSDTGYPPMTYTCDASTHTYTATITSVPSSAIGKEWGVSFRLSNGTTTAVFKDTLKQYTSRPTGKIKYFNRMTGQYAKRIVNIFKIILQDNDNKKYAIIYVS